MFSVLVYVEPSSAFGAIEGDWSGSEKISKYEEGFYNICFDYTLIKSYTYIYIFFFNRMIFYPFNKTLRVFFYFILFTNKFK